MIEILLIVLPVFLVIGIGYTAIKTGYLPQEIANHINNYTIKLAVPCLLFLAMYKLDFAKAFNEKMLFAFYIGAGLSFILGILMARIIWKRTPGEAIVVGFCAWFSNTVFLGLPIIERAYGASALSPVYAIISVHPLILYAVGIISMEMSRRDGKPLYETIKTVGYSIAQNPLIIAVTLGSTLNLINVEIPESILNAMSMIATSAIPAALIGIGASLTKYNLRSTLSESIAVTTISLFIHPGIAFLISHYILNLPIPFVQAATILAAMPPGVNGYIFATMYNRSEALAASSILIATPISIISISIWLSMINMLA